MMVQDAAKSHADLAYIIICSDARANPLPIVGFIFMNVNLSLVSVNFV